MTNEIKKDIQSLAPSSIIELFEVDLTALGDTIYRFHVGTNELEQNVVWAGETYAAWAGQAAGFDFSTSGQSPRPKLVLGNTLGTITALVILLNDCVGGKVTRKRTLQKYLDAVNFEGGVNDTADSDASLPDDVYFINRKTSETNESVEFELAAAYDVTGVRLPKRQVVQNLCPWAYRGAECGYTGPPVSDRNDNYLTGAVAVTQEETDLIESRDAMFSALADIPVKAMAITEAQLALTLAKAFVKEVDTYNATFNAKSYVQVTTTNASYGRGSTSTTVAYYSNNLVSLGDTYRTGSKVSGPTNQLGSNSTVTTYRIQRWGVDTVAEAAAQAVVDAAQSAYNDAVALHAASVVTYDNAVAALPSDSAIFRFDTCGKRLTSCKLRFGEDSELPFGGFPGAGLLS